MKEKIYNFFRWLKNECKDWTTAFILIWVIAIVYFPVWGGYLLYAMFGWNWCAVMASSAAIFWLGPFTPFFPLCIAITLTIKKIMQIKKRENNEEIEK